jgi:hypothetical protein
MTTSSSAVEMPIITIGFRSDGRYRCRLMLHRGQTDIDVVVNVEKSVLFDTERFVAALERELGHELPKADYARALELARASQSIEPEEDE